MTPIASASNSNDTDTDDSMFQRRIHEYRNITQK